MVNPFGVFATLTYAEEYLPLTPSGLSTVDPEHLTKYLMRVRNEMRKHDVRVRYDAVGEYGSQTGRPHYHALLFGFPWRLRDILSEKWDYGHVHVKRMVPANLFYVGSHGTKPEFRKDSLKLKDRHPEFRRYSTKPPIGFPGLQLLADKYRGPSRANAQMMAKGDIETAFNFTCGEVSDWRGKRSKVLTLPLDYPMAQRLRELVGLPTEAYARPPTHQNGLPLPGFGGKTHTEEELERMAAKIVRNINRKSQI